MEVKRKK